MEKKSLALAASLGLAGLVTGGVLMSSVSANAADSSGSGTSSSSSSTSGSQAGGAPNGNANGTAPTGTGDPTKPMRSDETLLTGTTAAKVTAAVKAKYPNATFQRVETDSDGVYEAHILVNGSPVTVEVDKSFAITGTEAAPGPRNGTTGPGAPAGSAPAA